MTSLQPRERFEDEVSILLERTRSVQMNRIYSLFRQGIERLKNRQATPWGVEKAIQITLTESEEIGVDVHGG